MTAIDPATCWVPVPIRWRYVQPGDSVPGRDGGTLLHVTGVGPDGNRFRVDLAQGYGGGTYYVDPDEMVSVLVPIPERDAGALTVEQLGAVVIGRRMIGEVA